MQSNPAAAPRAVVDGVPVHCAFDELLPPEQLVPHPRNPNTHPPRQVTLLAKVIGWTGWRGVITISRRSGFIVSGHCRREAALARGATAVPVEYQNFESEADEHAHLVADNYIAELAEYDAKGLLSLVTEQSETERAGVDAEALAVLKLPPAPPPVAPGARGGEDDAAMLRKLRVTLEEPQRQPEAGDTWVLGGRHVLLVVDVSRDWQKWVEHLVDRPDALFLPYPGILAPLTLPAAERPLVMVQPEPFLAGLLLDRYAEAHGPDSVVRKAVAK